MTTKRSLACSGLFAVLVLAVSGCGGDTPFPQTQARPGAPAATTATPKARLLAVVRNTTEAKTAKLAINMSMTGLAELGNVKVTGSGAMDLTHRRFEMQVQSTGVGAFSLEMRVINDTAYFNMGAGWTSQAVGATGPTTPLPTDYLDYLERISGDVRVEGHETVRGADTTRYGATIDLGRATDRAGSSTQTDAMRKLIAQLGLGKMPVTVWVDGIGRMRKMQLEMDLGSMLSKLGAPAGADPKISVTFELYDFGAPVSVQIPQHVTSAKSGEEFCLTDVCSGGQSVDTSIAHEIQSDLRNALTAEKTTYTDYQVYTADPAKMKPIEPSLDWGGSLKVVVGDAPGARQQVVCLSESKDGAVYALADIADGPNAGTFYGTSACPTKVDGNSFSKFATSGW